MLQHITYGVGGQIYLDAAEQLTTPTVSVYDGQGNTLVSDQSATLSTVDTTVSSAVSARSTSISVTSATGITAGGVYNLGGREDILVASISGTTVTLARPTFYAHANGAELVGFRVTYTVSAAAADRTFWFGFAAWKSNSNLYAHTSLCCTKQPLFLSTTIQDLIDADSAILSKLDSNADVVRMLQRGFEDVIRAIDVKEEARLFRASGVAFNKPIIYAVLRNHYMSRVSPTEIQLYDRYLDAFDKALSEVVSSLPRDTDEDGETNEEGEQLSFYTIPLARG